MSISKIMTQINEQSASWCCVSIAVFRARLELFHSFSAFGCLGCWLPSQLKSGFLQGVNQLVKTQRPRNQRTGKKARMIQRCHQLRSSVQVKEAEYYLCHGAQRGPQTSAGCYKRHRCEAGLDLQALSPLLFFWLDDTPWMSQHWIPHPRYFLWFHVLL